MHFFSIPPETMLSCACNRCIIDCMHTASVSTSVDITVQIICVMYMLFVIHFYEVSMQLRLLGFLMFKATCVAWSGRYFIMGPFDSPIMGCW